MGVSQKLSLIQASQNKEENYSKVRILWKSTQTGQSYNAVERTAKYYVSINGGQETEYSVNYTLPKGTTQTIVDATIKVQHDDEGKAEIKVRTWMDTHISAGVVELSKNLPLTTIPRASTVGASDANIGANTTVVVSKRSDGYTHSIAYAFGTLSGYITPDGGVSDAEEIFSESVISWTIPKDFYAEIPSSPNGECTLTVKTYSGASQIGTAQTATFTATAAESDVRPLVSGEVKDVNNKTIAVTGDDDVLVRFISDAKCAIRTTWARGGATIVERKIGGVVVSDVPSSRTIYGIETDTVEFRLTDSRGYFGTDLETVQMIPYVRLTNNAVASRVAPATGISVLKMSGNYFNDTFGLRANELTVTYTVDGGDPVTVSPTLDGNTYAATVEVPDLDYRTGHTMTVTVSDKLDTVVKEVKIGRSIPIYHHGDNFFAFYVPVEFRGGIAPGYDSGFTGTAAELGDYLKRLAAAGTMTARLSGTYSVAQKIPIPEGMTVMGGTFIADPAYEDALFVARGDRARLVGVTLAAPALDKVPKIFAESGVETTSLDSNVMGLFSDGWEGVEMVNCICDKIIPAKINNGSGTIRNCRITDTSMFAWASNCKLAVLYNDVSICDTGLDYYYHVYYLNEDSELLSCGNRIRCDTTTPYFDVFHLMTAGNDGTYRASGISYGDVITGNFQHIIDCHYADLILDGCHIANSNPDSWTEFSNTAHSSFAYRNCTLHFENAAEQTYDSSMSAPVAYHNCHLTKNARLNRRATYKDCRIRQDITSGGILANLVDVLNCELQVSGSPQCIGIISTGTLTSNFVGNMVKFEDPNTSDYLFNYAAIDGCICNNVFVGAGTAKLWHTDRGSSHNNVINGTAV